MAKESIAMEKLNHRLTAQDAAFIYGESRNGPMHIGSISFFEDEITYAELIRHFDSRLHLVPRYRQRLMPVPLNLDHATLEDDFDFKIENHVKLHQLPADASEAQLIEAAMAVFRKPLDRSRPLWEVHLFNGFKGNRSVILWLIHHCLVDGVSGMELLNVVMDSGLTRRRQNRKSSRGLQSVFQGRSDSCLVLRSIVRNSRSIQSAAWLKRRQMFDCWSRNSERTRAPSPGWLNRWRGRSRRRRGTAVS